MTKAQLIGNRVKHARINKRMTQQELADRLDVHRPIITELEKGNRQLKVCEMVELCLLFNVSPLDLLGVRYSKFTQNWEDSDETPEARSRRNGTPDQFESNHEFAFGW